MADSEVEMVEPELGTRTATAFVLVAMLLLGGCTGSTAHLRPFAGTQVVHCAEDTPDFLELTYLGAGGFLMRWRQHAILTGPFYSNPSLFEVGLGLTISPDVERIERLLPDVDDVEAILVGHSHYDHLMDARHVAEMLAPRAVLYGNQTMSHLLAGRSALRGRVVAMDAEAGDWERPGRWHYVAGRSIRFMALRSEHAPHVLGIDFLRGDAEVDQAQLPTNAYGWKEGLTLAFLVDFLAEDGAVRLRLHYQDSASNPPAGFPPYREEPHVERVDIAILCVASFEQVDDYPEAVVHRLRPQAVVLGHWESFFQSPELPLEAVPLTDTESFAARLTSALPDGADWYTPLPGAVLRVCPRR